MSPDKAEISFFVKGTPKAWKTPQFNRKTGNAYKPKQEKLWQESIWGQAHPHAPDEPWTGPIAVELRFHIGVPVSWPNWKINWFVEHEGWPETRPDVDNLCKAVLDALKGTFFLDDRQVVGLTAWKMYSSRRGVEVRIRQLASVPKTLAEAKARENFEEKA